MSDNETAADWPTENERKNAILLRRLAKGGVKSLPLIGALLEETIFGTWEELHQAESEQRGLKTLHEILAGVKRNEDLLDGLGKRLERLSEQSPAAGRALQDLLRRAQDPSIDQNCTSPLAPGELGVGLLTDFEPVFGSEWLEEQLQGLYPTTAKKSLHYMATPLNERAINVLFVPESKGLWGLLMQIRRTWGEVFIVIYGGFGLRGRLSQDCPPEYSERLKHYTLLEITKDEDVCLINLRHALGACRLWHRLAPEGAREFTYDVAISFAGEQRAIASELAARLARRGVRVFFDEYEQARLWGSDLAEELQGVYSRESHFCLIVVSEEYRDKVWTTLERRAALARSINNPSETYILLARVDAVELPGINPTVGYLDLKKVGITGVVDTFLDKHAATIGSLRE